ncbi:prepilin-type N-terminal cleavage/methylation domain-containing protein [Sporosarcina sp. FSL K6-6792]|uniref:PilW family protein n=1 Tax=Sporosarcina sp. FSL K6-6792 TaxID=2921559 RepID=UPI0030F6219C
MKKNESGMTLVEALATLTILSMVVVLIWTTFSISTKHSIMETTKLQLQQEANYILTEIQQQHRQLECYTLDIREDRVQLFNCKQTPELIEVISTNYKYKEYNSGDIKPKEGNLSFTLTVKDSKKDSKLKVEVVTNISRYKSYN